MANPQGRDRQGSPRPGDASARQAPLCNHRSDRRRRSRPGPRQAQAARRTTASADQGHAGRRRMPSRSDSRRSRPPRQPPVRPVGAAAGARRRAASAPHLVACGGRCAGAVLALVSYCRSARPGSDSGRTRAVSDLAAPRGRCRRLRLAHARPLPPTCARGWTAWTARCARWASAQAQARAATPRRSTAARHRRGRPAGHCRAHRQARGGADPRADPAAAVARREADARAAHGDTLPIASSPLVRTRAGRLGQRIDTLRGELDERMQQHRQAADIAPLQAKLALIEQGAADVLVAWRGATAAPPPRACCSRSSLPT